MPDWTQDTKAAQVTTILGKDKLLLERFTATASLSNPFEIIVEALSVDGVIDFTPHLGTGVHVHADLLPNNACDFHGLLFETMSLGAGDGLVRYRLTLRPWFSLLDMNRESRIYQNKSVQEIITDTFNELGFSGFEIKIKTAGAKPREYCVQYRESHFAFLSRLMEEEGIYYYFQHTDSAHTLVLCDDPTCHPLPGPDLVMVDRGAPKATLLPTLWAWDRRLRAGIVKTTLRDSNLYLPTATLDATDSAVGANTIENANETDQGDSQQKTKMVEFYDFPGGYAYHDPAGLESGAAYAAARLQEARKGRDVRIGHGNLLTAAVGGRIEIDDQRLYVGQTEPDHERQFMVVSATHSISGQDYAGAQDAQDIDVQVDLEAFPAEQTWRPARVTPKPVVGGPQTALVVGDTTKMDGGEPEVLEVDQYGRVHVQFYWDRIGEKNSSSSCWVRVSHGSADNGFGHVTLPRIGQEVIVDFLEGDPDRPIVTGRVYNADNLHPYALPSDKTKSTWKSQTVGQSGDYTGAEEPPTGKGGSNEIRYEDKGGSEELYVHAQRVFNAWYRLDETRKTGRDTTVRVGRDRVVNVKNNDTYTLEQGDEKHTISTGSLTTTIDQGSETHKLNTGSRTTTIQQNDSLTLTAGDYSMQVSAGQATIEALKSITLKVGENSIVINQQGITLQGIQVQITAQAALTAQGLETQVKADTQLTIQGAMVMINS